MPIAELLGMHFDMQLLGKLTLSVATMLFVSLVFRFYNSRARNRRRGSERIQQRGVQATRGSYSACNTEQEPQSKAAKEESDRENHFQESSEKPLEESLKNANSALKSGQPETMGLDSCVKEEPAGKNNVIEDITEAKSGKPKLTLKLPGVTETGQGSPSGRRSPVLMKKLEGGTGVGRQLRQDVGHQGMFSSFQSKAEIKVENADLILDGPGNCRTGIHGKIYEYYVESSSHFISDLSPTRSVSPVYGQNENSTSQLLDLPGFKDCSRTPSPQPSSFIIRDLEIAPRITNEPPSLAGGLLHKPETVRYSRQVVIRQDSYLTAASDSGLPIPLPTQRALTPRSCSPAQPNDIPSSPLDSDIANLDAPEEPQVKTVAGAKFLHFPENMGNAELESIAGKLDLGNCLEALTLAKKHGHTALQQAALRVMSDNYLQVLRDPGLFGRLKAGERDHIQTQRMRGRKWLVVADMDSPDWSRRPSQSMYLEFESVKSSSIYYYDDYKDTWHLHSHIPQEVLSKGCAMCTMDNYLFIAVGFQGSDREATPSKKVYCYNPMTSIWSEISPMNEGRPHCKLVALQGHLYAIGGECLSTVERYDPRTNRWTFVAPLPNETFAVAHKATACNGELFVAGGTLRYTLLRYNPKTNTWRESMIVGSKDKTTEIVAVRNFLYRFDVSPLGISVYRFHAVARLWYECASIRRPHCTAFQCVTMDNIIYCVSRQFTLRFLADEVSPSFVAQDLKVLSPAKGILFPFVLVLPDRATQQTCV
ncbi:kelch domain-containing protein 7A-like [Sinocyclocheilus rhinocerous]|uniref:kelch domain-containing protein 7A-like n=1 Tax=Sinocyclocheilus rhinocerous TaxID=307959 RepID=UPI0007B7EEB8|nr:PREDICTED: kelch domain-containing protein 7A-like [Sinocyclocheilus rhinocerous]